MVKVAILVFLCGLFAMGSGAGTCPETHPYVYYNGQYCCQTNKEKSYGPQGTKCDASEIQRDSMCCEGDKYTKCASGDCENFEGTCPETHPYVYYNGQYCCQTNKEKSFGPQGTKCDASEIQRDSMCCEGDKYAKCPTGNCKNYIGWRCAVIKNPTKKRCERLDYRKSTNGDNVAYPGCPKGCVCCAKKLFKGQI